MFCWVTTEHSTSSIYISYLEHIYEYVVPGIPKISRHMTAIKWLCTVLLQHACRISLRGVTVLLHQTCSMTAGCLLCYCSRPVEWLCTVLLCYCSMPVGCPCVVLLCYCIRLVGWLQGVTVLLQQVCTNVSHLNSLRLVWESLLCVPKREMGRSHCCATVSCQYPHSGTARGFGW